MIDKGEKAYSGLDFNGRGKQVRAIVVAKNQKEAAAKLRCSLCYFRDYWQPTINAIELEAARTLPGKFFMATGIMEKDFRAVPEREK